MIFVELPLLEKEQAGDKAADSQHHEGARQQDILASENGLGSHVHVSVAFPRC